MMSRSSSKYQRADDRPLRRVRSFYVDANLLRSLRLARGWTQLAAAERAGMTDRFIRKAESGRPIEFKSALLLAQLYSTPDEPLRVEGLLTTPRNVEALDISGDLPNHADALLRRWFEDVWSQGRLDAIDELFASDCVLRAEGVMLCGPAAIRRRVETIRAAFSDFDLRVEQVTAHADWIAAHWRVAMTHTGDWPGALSSGARVTAHGSTWIRVAGGIFVEGWEHWEQQQVVGAQRAAQKGAARSRRGAGRSGKPR